MLDQIEKIKRLDLKDFLQSRYGLEFNSSNQALCPFHDDKHPSLSVNEKDGTWLWHCFGCGKAGSIIDFLVEKEGFDKAEAISRLELELPIEGDAANIVEIYDYVDEKEDLLYQCVRRHPKSFCFRRPDGDGGWIWDLKGVRLVPYKLNEIKDARSVVVVEGEKDVETVIKILGWKATTNPMGAGKWREEYSQYFSGKQIVIIPDNDEPGKSHAKAVAASLLKVTNSVKIVELPSLPEKEDISYWLEHGLGNKEDLERLIKEAPQCGKNSPAQNNSPRAESLREFLSKDMPERQCLLGTLIAKNELTIISGPAKLGKSILSLNIALRLANGEGWLCFPVQKPCRTLIIQQEVSQEALRERLNKMVGSKTEGVAHDNLFLCSERGILLDSGEGLKKVKSLIEKQHPDVVILDPMYTFHTRKENSAEDMAAFFRIIHELVKNYGFALILVHHFGKPSLVDREGGELHRGSSVIAAASDSNWTFSRIPPNKFRLASLRSEYAVLSFEHRNARPTESLILHRNPDTLWYERINPEENKKVTAQDIVDVLSENGGQMLQSKILEVLENTAAPRLIKEAIYEAESKQMIASRTIRGKGNPKLLFLKEDLDAPL